MKEPNPFEGINGTTTPQDLLKMLVDRVIQTGDLKPIGGALSMLQKQLEAVGEFMGEANKTLKTELSQMAILNDVARLTLALVINILLEKEIITEEEFQGKYKEGVQDVMDKHMEDLKKKYEEAKQKEQEDINNFVKQAMETGDAITDPSTGEAIKFEEDTEETPAPEEYAVAETEETEDGQ